MSITAHRSAHPQLRTRAAIALASLLVVGALVAATGCQTTNSNYCCSTEQSCNAAGGSGEATPCTDPARPYCDDSGEYGPGRTCIPDPGASSCDGPADCTTDERPFCIGGTCSQCEDDTSCAPDQPVCDDGSHLCGPCLGDGDCLGRTGTLRCFTSGGACVACLEPGDCTSLEAPICDTVAHACVGCSADEQCTSAVCNAESGACLDEANVIYLSASGQGSGTCTRAAPCNSFALGLAQVGGMRTTIKAAPGTYTGPIAISGGTVTILADGATATSSVIGQTILAVSGGADATIVGLKVSGTQGNTGTTIAVTCNASTLRMRRATVVDNTAGAGMLITGCQYSLVNNVFASNGALTSPFGGIRITDITSAGLHEFDFNTVTGNVGTTNTVTGVECTSIATPLTFTNSIVHGNLTSGLSGKQVGDDGDCAWTYSDIGAPTVVGTGNVDLEPMFVAPATRNYHLQPTSPLRNIADPDSTVATDFDGDDRPEGGRSDMGADEITP